MDQNNYDFIMSQNAKPKATFGSSGGKKQRVILIVIAAAALLLIGIGLYTIISGGQKGNAALLAPVAAAQTDIIDITEIGEKEAGDAKLRNTTATTSLVVISQNNTIDGYLGKDAKKQIAPYRNTEFEKELEEAKNSGSFDKTYQAILNNRLDLYRQMLVTAYDQASTTKLKKELAAYHSQVGILLGEPTTPAETKQ